MYLGVDLGVPEAAIGARNGGGPGVFAPGMHNCIPPCRAEVTDYSAGLPFIKLQTMNLAEVLCFALLFGLWFVLWGCLCFCLAFCSP